MYPGRANSKDKAAVAARHTATPGEGKGGCYRPIDWRTQTVPAEKPAASRKAPRRSRTPSKRKQQRARVFVLNLLPAREKKKRPAPPPTRGI